MRLLLVQRQWHHSDILCEVDDRVEHSRVGTRMAHDLCETVLPDFIGKMEIEKVLGPTSEFCKLTAKQGR